MFAIRFVRYLLFLVTGRTLIDSKPANMRLPVHHIRRCCDSDTVNIISGSKAISGCVDMI